MLDLRSRTRQRLLAFYFTNPKARFHLRDLAERIGVDPSNLSKELRHLEQDGLFNSEVNGRQKYFSLNREYPLYTEVRRIVEKTIGAVPLLSQALKKIKGVQEAYLYGSFARNQQDAGSDIDVLLIGSPRAKSSRAKWKPSSGSLAARSTTQHLRERNSTSAGPAGMDFWKTSGTINGSRCWARHEELQTPRNRLVPD